MNDIQVGDRVRLLEREYVGGMLCDKTFPVAEPGSMATVTHVVDGRWYVFASLDGHPGENNELCLHKSEYEWVERPEPLAPLQRRCDGDCQHD